MNNLLVLVVPVLLALLAGCQLSPQSRSSAGTIDAKPTTVTATNPAATIDRQKLVGKWFSRAVGCTNFWTLDDDGSFSEALAPDVNPKKNGDTWSLQGDQLSIAMRQPDGSIYTSSGTVVFFENGFTFIEAVTGDKMVFEDY